MWRGLSQLGGARGVAGADVSPALARVGILGTVALWGAQYPLTHELAERWDPYTISLIRFPLGAAILLGFAAWRGDGLRHPPTEAPGLGRAMLLGAALSCFAALFTLGLAIGDPMTCAVIAAMAPLTAALVSWASEGKRPERALMLPILLVVPGAALASLELSAAAPARRTLEGAVLVLLAQACWSWYSIRAQHWLKGRTQIDITGRSLLYASPFLLGTFLLADGAGLTYADWRAAPLRDLGLFLLLTLGALVLGVVLWNMSVARLGVTASALHLNLIPVVAILVSLALGILPRPEQLAGGALVLAGVILAQRSLILRERELSS